MPVRLNIKQEELRTAELSHPMRRHRDKIVHQIAPILEELRQCGTLTIDGTATVLNQRDLKTSRGSPWSYSTMREAMIRAGELGYAVRCQTQSEAAERRPFRYRG